MFGYPDSSYVEDVNCSESIADNPASTEFLSSNRFMLRGYTEDWFVAYNQSTQINRISCDIA